MDDRFRFIIFMAAAAVVFLAVLLFVIRKRKYLPDVRILVFLTMIVVVLGMLFARYGHIFFNLPWSIDYGIPALMTFALPPLALRMSRNETLQYVPSAVLMAPVIHISFSLFVGWHDYMPFPWYIPSLAELLHNFR
jgi:hypothetical protein